MSPSVQCLICMEQHSLSHISAFPPPGRYLERALSLRLHHGCAAGAGAAAHGEDKSCLPGPRGTVGVLWGQWGGWYQGGGGGEMRGSTGWLLGSGSRKNRWLSQVLARVRNGVLGGVGLWTLTRSSIGLGYRDKEVRGSRKMAQAGGRGELCSGMDTGSDGLREGGTWTQHDLVHGLGVGF